MQYYFEDRKNILQRLNDLQSKKCDIQIFKIILANNINHCTNNNGVFFNFNNLENNVIQQIDNIVNYHENKRQLSETSEY